LLQNYSLETTCEIFLPFCPFCYTFMFPDVLYSREGMVFILLELRDEGLPFLSEEFFCP